MATASELPRGKPNGHNARERCSVSLSPGRFGYNTFAYPVRYSYKRGARTSLFRPYQSLFSGILPLSQKSKPAGMNDAQKTINLLERIECLLQSVSAELRLSRLSEFPSGFVAGLASSRAGYRSSGLRPVCLAMRASIAGPISAPSWNAHVYSGRLD
jgi:hypothetical protein